MLNQFSRSEMIFGKEALKKLADSHVAVFGIGGVGGYVVEALARSGVGHLDLIDSDKVSLTNLNRQIVALHSTIGMYKTEAAKNRISDINPKCEVNVFNVFLTPENSQSFDFAQYDYIVDAVDTVTAKICLIEKAEFAGVPIISSMGTGNKLNPAMLEVTDIYKTSVCPLARVMRQELKKRGIKHLKVVYSKEIPLTPDPDALRECSESGQKKQPPGSTAFVPPTAGLIIASEVVKYLTGKQI